jgi:hypothetical protein
MVKKKRKKKVKKKPSQTLFAGGGLTLLIIGGLIGIFYQTLYMLITQNALKEQSLYYMGSRVLQELGMLLVFCAVVLGCFYYRTEKEAFQKGAGFVLLPAALISIPTIIYVSYDRISLLQDQVFTNHTFVTQTLPTLLLSISKVYFFAGALLLGIVFIGLSRRKSAIDWFLTSGAFPACAVLIIFLYTIYDSYFVYVEQGASTDLIMARIVIPGVLRIVSYLVIIGGVLLFAASRLWHRPHLKVWTGRTWVLGGLSGAFYEFIMLGLNAETIREEILRVRQYIMELTPYSTSLYDLPLTTETLREFYVKKMIPLYMNNALWILVFAGITMLGMYFWLKK